jgi:hypothetical protein
MGAVHVSNGGVDLLMLGGTLKTSTVGMDFASRGRRVGIVLAIAAA